MSSRKIRNFAIFIVILALVGLNVWRYWPESRKQISANRAVDSDRDSNRRFRLGQFVVHALPNDSSPPLQRDLFQPKLAPRPVKRTIVRKPVKPPPKSAEQLAREAAEADLAQIRCVGVSFRGGKAQAFLQKGTENYLVSQGDKVEDRFIVEKITAEAVDLQDPTTGVGGTIKMSGN